MARTARPSDLAELRATNNMIQELKDAVAARPVPLTNAIEDINQKRSERNKYLASLRHLMPVPGPIPEDVVENELYVPSDDGSGYQVRVAHYCPTERTRLRVREKGRGWVGEGYPPLVILVHEGGWSLGDLTDEEFNARLLVRDLGVVCLNVEYRLAPEYPFPTGVLDCWAVVKWAAKQENASRILADPTKGIVVGGSSAGGNISAVLAHLSRTERLNPPITGQWLSVPYLLPHQSVPEKYRDSFISSWENLNDPVLVGTDVQRLEEVLRNMVKADMDSPLWSVLAPSLYPPTSSANGADGTAPSLAKAFFQVAGMDPLRDHALIYDRILREEYGVDTRLELYSGVGHMFWTNWPELDISKQYSIDMIQGFRWLLGLSQT